MSSTRALAMLDTMPWPNDSRTSATEGVVLAGSNEVWSTGFGALTDIGEGIAVSTGGCEIDRPAARSPVLSGGTDRAGGEIGGTSMDATDGVKMAGGPTETGGGSENIGGVTDPVGIGRVSTFG